MQEAQWQLLLESLEKLDQTNSVRIRALTIHRQLSWESELEPGLKRLPLLTSIDLVRTSLTSIPLLTMLHLCPRLEYVNVYADKIAYLVRDPTLKSSVVANRESFPLKSLKLRSLCVTQAELTAVLTLTPTLQELHLIQLSDIFTDPQSIPPPDRAVTLNDMAYFRQVEGLCPQINSLHISPSYQQMTTAKVAELWSLFPLVTRWSFTELRGTGDFSMIVASPMNVLTSLELKVAIGPIWSPELVHNLLCEAHHLVHFRSESRISLELLDLEGNLTSNGSYRVIGDPELSRSDPDLRNRNYVCLKDRPRRIWACRNLQTLDIVIGRNRGDSSSSNNTRLIFSYITKVCPNLEELSVRYAMMVLFFESGFCLLSRLHQLRRLVLVFDTGSRLPSKELEWMSRQLSPITWIQKFMDSKKRAMPEREHVAQLAPFSSSERASVVQDGHESLEEDEDPDYMVGGVDMRNLGRMRDITEMMEERRFKKWTCWPVMEEIRLQDVDTFGDRMLERDDATRWVKTARPDIRFVCGKYPRL
ncbi:hypothetical protein BGZ74_009109 [Mortierella antarctica]|nr:hypothetical protein BGZ74_009109 [Mortierella antarctica]